MSTEPAPEPRATHRHDGWHEHSLTDLGDATEPHTHAATPSSVTPDLRAALGRAMRRANAAAIPDTEEWQARMRAQADDLIVAARAEGIDMSLASVTPSEPTLDVERLARAICASREPAVPATADLFVDDDCRRLARLVAAQYAELEVEASGNSLAPSRSRD